MIMHKMKSRFKLEMVKVKSCINLEMVVELASFVHRKVAGLSDQRTSVVLLLK
ncbi:hypothetical protein Hanom_Chr00s000001g01593401 [Helianthus anomalus]